MLPINRIFHFIVEAKFTDEWSEKHQMIRLIPPSWEGSNLPRHGNAFALCRCKCRPKSSHSQARFWIEAQRNFLMAMKRLRRVRQTVNCLCAIPMPLACIGCGHSAEAPTAASASPPRSQRGGAPDKAGDSLCRWLFFKTKNNHLQGFSG